MKILADVFQFFIKSFLFYHEKKWEYFTTAVYTPKGGTVAFVRRRCIPLRRLVVFCTCYDQYGHARSRWRESPCASVIIVLVLCFPFEGCVFTWCLWMVHIKPSQLLAIDTAVAGVVYCCYSTAASAVNAPARLQHLGLHLRRRVPRRFRVPRPERLFF